MSKIEVGDRVQYSVQWLRSIGEYTGSLPHAKGTVKKLVPLGSKFLAVIDWGDLDVPEKVLTNNLKKLKTASVDVRMQRIAARICVAENSSPWGNLPKGWSKESATKMWNTLVGDVKHPTTKCIKKLKGKMSNPGAFCASLHDLVSGKKWRSEARKKKTKTK